MSIKFSFRCVNPKFPGGKKKIKLVGGSDAESVNLPSGSLLVVQIMILVSFGREETFFLFGR